MTSDDPDLMWRRPAGGETDRPPTGPTYEPAPVYTGPPRSQPPPRQQSPAPLIQPLPPPRPLPPQDHEAIDAEEEQARLVTFGVAIGAAVVAVLLVLFIAVRSLAN